ncbi:hypothetical protein HPP92_013982 [Vanilla planifolia]|uniref:Uncharacterized protein n=1 Tax=Vanilla planifolia TaxID=51239 RepID=A0A835QPF2_VANPL|nr:hypothetical protein HPP92_013982 [Vanilla planifolia]
MCSEARPPSEFKTTKSHASKDHLQSPKSSFIDFSAEKQEGWISLLKATWNHKTLRILSIWWAVAYAGFSLIQNYGTNLFDAIDSKSKFNGHILAASQAAGSFGAHYAVYIETLASKSGLKMYVLGMVLIGILCLCMGLFRNIWSGYLTYVAICGIYQTLACLVTARCGRLLSNGQFILLFSVNTFGGLLLKHCFRQLLYKLPCRPVNLKVLAKHNSYKSDWQALMACDMYNMTGTGLSANHTLKWTNSNDF